MAETYAPETYAAAISAPWGYAESPLATRAEQLATAADPDQLRLREIAFTTQINLRVDPKSAAAERIGTALGVMLPNQPGDVTSSGDLSVLWLGPDEWLIVGPQDASARLHSTLRDALDEEFGAVTDVSAQRTIVEISGPRARDLLAKGCAIDLHPRSFAQDKCAQTLLARAQVVLVCRDSREPRYWLMVRSSFARYLADWLADAAGEYGGVVT
jgi:sarcosine oxidase, subunit gamma